MTRITVRVTPRASRDAIGSWDGDVLGVRTTAPPVDGRANEAVIRLLAKKLDVGRSRISLVGGAAARLKVFDIEGMTDQELRALLAGTPA